MATGGVKLAGAAVALIAGLLADGALAEAAAPASDGASVHAGVPAARIAPLAANCLVCHPARPADLRGLDRPLVPLADLGRLPPDRIEAALRAFRANAAAGTVMPRIARALDDADIAALATAFAPPAR